MAATIPNQFTVNGDAFSMTTFRASYHGIDPSMNGRIGTAWPLHGEANPASHNFDAYGFQPDGEEWAGICGSSDLVELYD